MQESEVKLLECPFCGSNNISVSRPLFNWSEGWVLCEDCSAAGGVTETREKAVELWNTRTPDTTKLVEALEFYARDNQYEYLLETMTLRIQLDNGRIARQALESVKGGK